VSADRIRVFIADDHRLFRAGLIELLRSREGLEIVGEAADGREACRLVAEVLPDVVLMDIDFGPTREREGIDAARRIAERHGDRVKVIMLTMHGEDENVVRAFEAGAKGYVLKEADPDRLLRTIREVYEGGVILSPQQAEKVLERFRQWRQARRDEDLAYLTEREKEILQLVAQGASNEEIAARLGISEKTVRNRLSVIFDKLHVNNRTQAARYALRLGLISADEPEGPESP
jgi:DNA-binding NarL/FixJ family response regulator